jgi:autotransporter-associated beta strand protein
MITPRRSRNDHCSAILPLSESPVSRPSVSPSSPPRKVLLVGWDAADWKVIQPLLDAGKMPHLARFLGQGVRGNIATLQPALSPTLWTSIATGKRPYKHGILGFSEPDPVTGTLTGANTYSGGTTLTGGTLALGSANAIGTSGTISFGGGTLQASARNTTDYSARFSNAASQQYKIDTNSQNITLTSALTSSGGSFTKLGGGTLTLTGANTYSGTTTISAGTLSVGGGSTTGSIAGNVTNNSTRACDGRRKRDEAGKASRAHQTWRANSGRSLSLSRFGGACPFQQI